MHMTEPNQTNSLTSGHQTAGHNRSVKRTVPLLQFFDEFDIYQKIMRHNYMCHQQIAEAMRSYVPESHLTVLDLGCGDGSMAVDVLSACEDVIYCGIDQSAAALNGACLQFRQYPQLGSILRRERIEHMLPKLNIQFDWVMAGYVLHHLDIEGKLDALAEIQRLLSTGGTCMVYDLLPAIDESVPSYKARLIEHGRRHWRELNPGEFATARAHIEAEDQPVDFEIYETLASLAGFTSVELCYRDADQLFGLMAFSNC